ncbi:MAG: ABC transporter ATP-binding protein [Acholeplasmataceae bacterium]
MILSKNFIKYYFKYGLYFLVGIAILVVINWIQLEIPRLIGLIIDELTPADVPEPMAPNVTLIEASIRTIAIIALVITFGRFIWRYTIFGASRRIEYELRNIMFLKATRLPQSFYSHEKVGGMMTYFINDLEAIRMAFGPGVLMLVDGLVLGSFAVYRMASLQPVMTLFAAIPMLILMVVMVFLSKTMQLKFKKRQEAFEKLSDFTQENFSGITVVKAFVRELKEAMLFRLKNEELYDKNIKFVRYLVVIQLSISIAINMVVLLIVLFGSILVLRPGITGLTSGQLTEYIAYFFTLVWPVMAISRFIYITSQAKASAKRIDRFLDAPIEVEDHKDVIKDVDLTGHIEIKNLSFQYPDGDDLVLKDISFEIKPGQMVGILGRTGSGKSSMVDLLLRIYNLNRGQLFIDGYDIMDLPIQSIRDTIGYVPQDNFLFSDTITNNIGFAFDEISKEDVIKAAKLADVYENVTEFKDQFETMLGERGVTVSGGQKQRLSIARALAKDPKVLILDDSVSAVDTKTEEAIIKNLHEVRKGKTTIFIAHRISTVKKMDVIILLEQGKLVAKGSHKELMKTCELYQEMVRRQTLENLVEGAVNTNEGL